MSIKEIIDAVTEIAADVAARTETNKDDLAIQIWQSIYKRFGPVLFGASGDESATDGLPSAAVPPVDALIAKIELEQQS